MRRITPSMVAIAGMVILVVGGLLAAAAAPSRPGMFLYPVRTLTQQVTGALIDTVVIAVPAAVREVPGGSPSATQQSVELAPPTPAARAAPDDGDVDVVDAQRLRPTAAGTQPAAVDPTSVAYPTPSQVRPTVSAEVQLPPADPTATPVPASYVDSLVPAATGAAASGRVEAADGSDSSDRQSADGSASNDSAPERSHADDEESDHAED